MNFSYSAIWDDSVRLLKAHGSLLIAIAGAFLLLPELLVGYFYPRPEPTTMAQMITLSAAYISQHWPALLLATILNAIGAITMLLLLFDRGMLTVGGAIRAAMPLLIPYLIASFIANLLVFSGILLFVLPGLYLIARTATVGAVVVAENRRNPIDAVRRAFELTRRRGWAVLGLLVAVYLSGILLTFAASRVIGSVFLLAAGTKLGGLLSLILDAGLSAALTTVTLVVTAAIYRWLTAEPQSARPRITGI